MTENPVAQLALTFATLALFSMGGGNSLTPEFHRQVVVLYGWMTSAEFAHVVALAQMAPGPNMLVVSLIGWKVADFNGLLASTAAIMAPTGLLAFAAGRGMTRMKDAWWLGPVKVGLAPVVIGLMAASGVVIARAANPDALSYVLTFGAAAFIYATRRNPLWAIAAGALAGVAGQRLGVFAFA